MYTVFFEIHLVIHFSSVQFSRSVMSNYSQPHQAFLSNTNSQSLSNSYLLSRWCHPTISSSVIPIFSCLQPFPASSPVFSNESFLHIMWPKYWSFSFNISPSNEYSGLISFKIDRFDLLAVQGILKIFSNTTVQKHQFFSAQLSSSPTLTFIHDHWKNHSLD